MEKAVIGGRKFVVVAAGGDAGLGTTISDTLWESLFRHTETII
jgi:hypothetical protein